MPRGTLALVLLLLTCINTIQAQRGDPASEPPYASETITFSNATSLSSSCSGCGEGSCVESSYYSDYASEIDNKARQGIFLLKTQWGVSCNFLNNYFSGYVCPCESVCYDFTTYNDFLRGYCRKFVSGNNRSRKACRDYVWNCCDYPYLCWSSICVNDHGYIYLIIKFAVCWLICIMTFFQYKMSPVVSTTTIYIYIYIYTYI